MKSINSKATKSYTKILATFFYPCWIVPPGSYYSIKLTSSLSLDLVDYCQNANFINFSNRHPKGTGKTCLPPAITVSKSYPYNDYLSIVCFSLLKSIQILCVHLLEPPSLQEIVPQSLLLWILHLFLSGGLPVLSWICLVRDREDEFSQRSYPYLFSFVF